MTTSAVTKTAPAAGRPTTTITAIRPINTRSIVAAGHPAAAAKSESNATSVASFKPTTMHRTPTIETMPSKSASLTVSDAVCPSKNRSNPPLPGTPRLTMPEINVIPSPNETLRTIAVAASSRVRVNLRMKTKRRIATIAERRPPTRSTARSRCPVNSKAVATPTSVACAAASPTRALFRRTPNVPTTPAAQPTAATPTATTRVLYVRKATGAVRWFMTSFLRALLLPQFHREC